MQTELLQHSRRPMQGGIRRGIGLRHGVGHAERTVLGPRQRVIGEKFHAENPAQRTENPPGGGQILRRVVAARHEGNPDLDPGPFLREKTQILQNPFVRLPGELVSFR